MKKVSAVEISLHRLRWVEVEDRTGYCFLLFPQFFPSPTNLFTVPSSADILHQVAGERQQGRFTALLHLLSSAPFFFIACAFSGEKKTHRNEL